jgi:hypothetical protein
VVFPVVSKVALMMLIMAICSPAARKGMMCKGRAAVYGTHGFPGGGANPTQTRLHPVMLAAAAREARPRSGAALAVNAWSPTRSRALASM